MKTKIIALSFIICVISAIYLNGCGADETVKWNPGKPLSGSEIKIGIIYLDEAESGWSYAHELGLKEAQREFGLDDSQILRKFNVSEEDTGNIEYAISEAIAQGANLIIAPSWGFMDVCEQMAAEHPNVIFAHASGYKHNDANFTNYFGRLYQARYLTGIAAGLKTQTGKVGFVAAQGVWNSEVTGWLNAFAMGVERVNPEAQIYVSVTNSWFDPAGERRAAQLLLDEGCDVIAQHCDTAEPQIAAENAGVWGIGTNVDMSSEAPDAVLTSAVWNWDAYYTFLIGSIIDGSFTTAPYFGGLSDGMVDIAPLAPSLTVPGMAEAISEARESIVNGSFNIFDGELETNDGRKIGKSGETLSDSEITGEINWYYRNIVVLE
ncbi:MAG: BMP family ABC transporter substrate-binding protein [Oscillospiraceae bacterium]|nr:BMP family ABC transporter substrate-binding protein [Oscillospiraceae bacterium]